MLPEFAERGKAVSPEEIVRAEIAAWGRNDVDEVMSYFADNLTLHTGPYAPSFKPGLEREVVVAG